ncbi:MAG TPA: Uma2 family endonuclease [Longimicrobium sp.]
MSLPALQYPNGISYEEFLATVDEGTYAEWVDGEVVPVTPPSDEHAQITLFFAEILDGFVRRTRIGGQVRHSPFQMKLPSSARQPDVLWAAADKADRFKRLGLEGPADLVVEVVSPESRTRDRREKFREYAQVGVAEYWIVDPMQRTCEVFRLSGAGTYLPLAPGDPARVASSVVTGFWIDPAWLWAESRDMWRAFEAWGLI